MKGATMSKYLTFDERLEIQKGLKYRKRKIILRI